MNITTSLSPAMISRLDDYSKKFKIAKSKLLEQALESYFEKIKKAEYVRSFRLAASDEDTLLMAEEGLEDYLKILGEE
jgi:predicted transcriptional regulator